MKTPQFKQLAGLGFVLRLPLLIEGLEAIAQNIDAIATEFEVCGKARAFRAAELHRIFGQEEAVTDIYSTVSGLPTGEIWFLCNFRYQHQLLEPNFGRVLASS